MNNDELDRMFSRQEDIVPSSGFAQSVMDAVRNESMAPPPIAFPWKRALPGAVALIAAIGWLTAEWWRAWKTPAAASSGGSSLSSLLSSVSTTPGAGFGWAGAALLLSLMLVLFTLRLARK